MVGAGGRAQMQVRVACLAVCMRDQPCAVLAVGLPAWLIVVSAIRPPIVA
eukprot:CAMPEP_0119111124 /NCGR_PEP_ID=MMETSP1180-20130426/34061_1 /TAXON_ID=3052 ORGANISM="Chlamydomonas cf sp, Strain CCMP681" /NCGR_SAMPLE_ID=MMETSP1180 /ASSEMBLY_ACC=CAM_ASM_000741 /LENGTH=49 /DNA_ID= /DNA_START= /DNA_END= /DNA_ORIENTATION=